MARKGPIWVNIGKIWGIFTVFSNFGQKMDHLVNFFVFLKSAKKSYELVCSFFDGFTDLGQFWPNLGHFYSFLQFWSKNGPFGQFYCVFEISEKFPTTSCVRFLMKFEIEKSILIVAPFILKQIERHSS